MFNVLNVFSKCIITVNMKNLSDLPVCSPKATHIGVFKQNVSISRAGSFFPFCPYLLRRYFTLANINK